MITPAAIRPSAKWERDVRWRMASTIQSDVVDPWLLPVLADLLSREKLEELARTAGESYWRAVVEQHMATDDDLLKALSARTRFRLARDLVVSAPARDQVPEKLARRFGILPLAISQSVLDVAVSNPYDLDCEQLLAFTTGRRVRISLAA